MTSHRLHALGTIHPLLTIIRNRLSMFQSLRLPLALGLTLALAACATGTSNTLGSLPDSRNTDLDRTLAAADKKKGADAISLYLAAADLAWQQGDSFKARSLIESLDLEQGSPAQVRSEERRVGKECRSGWRAHH